MGRGIRRLPDGIAARPIAAAETPAWAGLIAAAERVDDEGVHFDANDLAGKLAEPDLAPETDTLGLWAADRMVGYGLLRPPVRAREVDRIRSHATIHPAYRRRGLGGALLGWLDERATAVHDEHNPDLPGELIVDVVGGNAGLRAMVGAAGFEPCRYFAGMERDLAAPPPAPGPPPGLRVATFAATYEEATRLAHNEAFGDSWGSVPRDPATWRAQVGGAGAFAPALSYLLLDGDTVAAYTLAYVYGEGPDVYGEGPDGRRLEVGLVGTRPTYRGRGAARAALTRTLAAAATAGIPRAALGVDTGNPTGALGLYERLGFVVRRQWAAYRRPLRAPTA